jgi:hypothetical protein
MEWLRLLGIIKREGSSTAGIDCGYVPQDAAAGNPALGTRLPSRCVLVRRSVQRPLSGIGFWVLLLGCGTDAVGVGECRALERARCAAGAACGFRDVAACERYERDHCLHGVALDDVSVAQIDACVLDVERAGRCAASQGVTTPANTCAEPVILLSPGSACDVVRTPERAASCAFLAPGAIVPVTPPVVQDPDAGS